MKNPKAGVTGVNKESGENQMARETRAGSMKEVLITGHGIKNLRQKVELWLLVFDRSAARLLEKHHFRHAAIVAFFFRLLGDTNIQNVLGVRRLTAH